MSSDPVPPVSKKGRRGNPPGMGRPRAKIDWDKVDQWLIAGATGTQIAASLGTHPDTLYLNCERDHKMTFSAYSHEKRSIGDRLIHAAQFELAVKNKNATMLIWLGKQRCGQKERDDDIQVTPETLAAFSSFMDMLNKAQSDALNKADTNNNTESTS